MFTDFMFDECKCAYFPSAEKGCDPGNYKSKRDAPYGSLDMAYFNISQRNQDDLFTMENLKMI